MTVYVLYYSPLITQEVALIGRGRTGVQDPVPMPPVMQGAFGINNLSANGKQSAGYPRAIQ